MKKNSNLTVTNYPNAFSCPYELGDLRILSSRLDDILDAIEEAAFRLSSYRFNRLVTAIPESCAHLRRCIDGISGAMETILQTDGPMPDCTEIARVWKSGDELLRQSIGELLSNNDDAITVFTNKEICNTLEQAFSCCKSTVSQLLTLEAARV